MAEEKKTTQKKETPKAPKKPVVKAEKKPVKKTEEKKTVNEVKASARFIRVSPRKVRLVLDQIRGLDATRAQDTLRFMNKGSVPVVSKLLASAIANAENNFEIDKKDLFVKKITADDGPTLKRFRPRAFGRSTMIRKRTSHINLILGVKEGAKLGSAPKKVESKEVKVVNPEDVKQESSKHIDKSSGNGEGSKTDKGFMKGVFQRKTG